MPKLYKILALTYAALILTSGVTQYWINYSKSDGVVLPNHEVVGGDFLCFSDLLTGIALSISYYKPPLFLLFVL